MQKISKIVLYSILIHISLYTSLCAINPLIKFDQDLHKIFSQENTLIAFLEGRKADDKNRLLTTMWNFTPQELEQKHDFIQWWFPTKTRSVYNQNAPLLDDSIIQQIKRNPQALNNMRESFKRICNFFGIEIVKDNGTVACRKARDWPRPGNVWTRGNHNLLRISRILESLGLMGLHSEQNALFQFLDTLYKDPQYHSIIEPAYSYWQQNALIR
jgi:hypothetical protein